MSVVLNERQQYILEQLDREKKVLVASLAEKLGVAPETIRRDLDTLEKEKKLKRVHGGAVKFHHANHEPHFVKKMNVKTKAKEAIGKKAAAFIEDGDTIMIDVGTTTIHVAKAISGVKDVTIVTNSLAAAEELNTRLENQDFDGKIIVLGGITNPTQKSIVGAMTCKMLKGFRFDKLFLSCGGITMEDVSDFDFEECLVSSTMIERANQVFLLLDSSKVGHESFYKICSLSSVDCIICDAEMPAAWKQIKFDQMIKWVRVEGGEEDEG
ncbi:DeoR/GlpR family DNA-binding transcription regulator [Bacillus salipaludis]|uniref:DeoR/GlpR family DNA-binding transcription regulator n=1 Tax=Bacillus salipaludis TaxID=2547811 RepID=A0AA90QXC2_9BACI|nr:DeoR/GlpR family DNA-binding transcription regulator [Bacillus salipaludis]MDQ6598579.1 DeoR/GlpR family DNA-binding transcription regulator [Bacillus salipaludis]